MPDDPKPFSKIFEQVPEGTDTSKWVRHIPPEKATFPTFEQFVEKLKEKLDELPEDVRAIVKSGDRKKLEDLWAEAREEWDGE